MTQENKTIQRKLKGTIVSDKMEKTVVVSIDRVRTHSKYKKQYTSSKKYKVHDPENKGKVGDIVEFVACRPMSKDKRWRLIKVVS